MCPALVEPHDLDRRGEPVGAAGVENCVALSPDDQDRDRSLRATRSRKLAACRPPGRVLSAIARKASLAPSIRLKRCTPSIICDETRSGSASSSCERRLDVLALLGGDEALDERAVDLVAKTDRRDPGDGGDPLGGSREDLEGDRAAQRMADEMNLPGADVIDEIRDRLAQARRGRPRRGSWLDLP